MTEKYIFNLYRITTEVTNTSSEDPVTGVYVIDEDTKSTYTPVLPELHNNKNWQNMYNKITTVGNVTKRADWDDYGSIFVVSHETFVKFALVAELYEGLADSLKLQILDVLLEEGTVKYVLKVTETNYEYNYNEGSKVLELKKILEPAFVTIPSDWNVLLYGKPNNTDLVIGFAKLDDFKEIVTKKILATGQIQITYKKLDDSVSQLVGIADTIRLIDFYNAEVDKQISTLHYGDTVVNLNSITPLNPS